jgi:hypothetical protein
LWGRLTSTRSCRRGYAHASAWQLTRTGASRYPHPGNYTAAIRYAYFSAALTDSGPIDTHRAAADVYSPDASGYTYFDGAAGYTHRGYTTGYVWTDQHRCCPNLDQCPINQPTYVNSHAAANSDGYAPTYVNADLHGYTYSNAYIHLNPNTTQPDHQRRHRHRG